MQTILLRYTKPTSEYTTYSGLYCSVYKRLQPNPVYKPTSAYELLERLTPSSPYNCPCSVYNLALHSNKKKVTDSIRLYLFSVYKHWLSLICPEPVFVDLLRSPGIDSQPGGPVRKPYLSYWPARLHGLAK
jgi:hypothetical protein